MTDIEIWQKFKQGDRKAFKSMYDLHVVNISNYCLRFTKDNEIIADCIHDLYVRLWNNRATIGDTDNIVKYLCVSVRRDIIRRVQKQNEIDSFDAKENYDFDAQLSPEDALIENEQYTLTMNQVQSAMNDLSGRQKEAIYLKYFKDMSYDEICEIMDINYQSVRNLISKGILTLRENMSMFAGFLVIFLILFIKNEYKVINYLFS